MDIKTKYFKQKETRLILKNKADISQKKTVAGMEQYKEIKNITHKIVFVDKISCASRK